MTDLYADLTAWLTKRGTKFRVHQTPSAERCQVCNARKAYDVVLDDFGKKFRCVVCETHWERLVTVVVNHASRKGKAS